MAYADDDIKSGGMPDKAFNSILQDSLSVSDKWEILKPYWENSFNTAYNRVTLLSAQKLFGIDDFNEKTVVEVSDKIKEAYKKDWFHTVLKDKCKI